MDKNRIITEIKSTVKFTDESSPTVRVPDASGIVDEKTVCVFCGNPVTAHYAENLNSDSNGKFLLTCYCDEAIRYVEKIRETRAKIKAAQDEFRALTEEIDAKALKTYKKYYKESMDARYKLMYEYDNLVLTLEDF